MIEIFRGEGVVDGVGGSSERFLKWGGGGGGIIKGSFQKHLKIGVGKGKSCSNGGGGFEGVTTPALPRKILIIHHFKGCLIISENL